ncbi:MAG: hypothetical protein U1F50_07125 [Rubrivivax sp.]
MYPPASGRRRPPRRPDEQGQRGRTQHRQPLQRGRLRVRRVGQRLQALHGRVGSEAVGQAPGFHGLQRRGGSLRIAGPRRAGLRSPS